MEELQHNYQIYIQILVKIYKINILKNKDIYLMLMIDKINLICRKGRKIVKEVIFLDQIVLFLSNFKKIF